MRAMWLQGRLIQAHRKAKSVNDGTFHRPIPHEGTERHPHQTELEMTFRYLTGLTMAAALLLSTPQASAQPTPAPSYMELLEAVGGSTYWGNGKFWFFDTHSFAFLPESDGYNSFDGTPFEIRYLKDGSEVARARLNARTVNGPFQNTTDVEGIDFDDSGAGLYTVEWLLGGETFYQFPFEAEEIASEDPYATGSKWAVNGPWGDYLIVKVPRGNTVGAISLLFYDRVKAYERDRGSERGVMVEVERDGIPSWRAPSNDWYYNKGPNFSEHSGVGGVTYEGTPWWSLIEVTPKTYWPEAELDPSNMEHEGTNIEPSMFEDGTYTATVSLFDHRDVEGDARLTTIRGNVISQRTATFDIQDGKVVPRGAQAPGADSMTRIEGAQSDLNYEYLFIPWSQEG